MSTGNPREVPSTRWTAGTKPVARFPGAQLTGPTESSWFRHVGSLIVLGRLGGMVSDGGGDADEQFALAARARASGVRRQHQPGSVHEGVAGGKGFLPEHVEPGAAEPPVPEPLRECGFVHEAAARGVHEDRSRLHPVERRAVQHVLGLGGVGNDGG